LTQENLYQSAMYRCIAIYVTDPDWRIGALAHWRIGALAQVEAREFIESKCSFTLFS
jgi:chemotaxis receptor (MCP) glutamine deamidase CheD